jgi:hypothetical protein
MRVRSHIHLTWAASAPHKATLMLTRRAILVTAACSIAAFLTATRFAGAGPSAPDDASALAFISAIYKSYTTGSKDGVRIDTGRKLRRYFEPVLAAAMDKDQETAAKRHEVGELDGDPFIDAQDYEIKHFDLAIKDTAPGKATATVTFDNFDKQRTMVLELIAVKNDWRIYDITWPRDEEPKTLRGLFRLTRQGY